MICHIIFKNRETLKKIYQLTLLNPELTLKERYESLITRQQKDEWKEEFEKLTQAASEDRKIREVEELFDKDPIKTDFRRREAACEMEAGLQKNDLEK